MKRMNEKRCEAKTEKQNENFYKAIKPCVLRFIKQ
jgi:hypothetical protein